MTGMSSGSGRAMAKRFPWKKYRTFIDAAELKAPCRSRSR